MTWVFLHSILTTSMKPRNLMSNKNFDVLKYIHHFTRFLIDTIFMMMKKLQKLWPESIFRILLISLKNLEVDFTTFYCRRSSSTSMVRFCASSTPFQNRWENSRIPIGNEVISRFIPKLPFFYLKPSFSTFSRRSSSTTSQAHLCA